MRNDTPDGERVPPTELPQLRYSANRHAERLRSRALELPASHQRDAALMTEAADQLEHLSRAELDNHHSATMCPYCTPDETQREHATSVDLMGDLYGRSADR